jgi:hypothetical protein
MDAAGWLKCFFPVFFAMILPRSRADGWFMELATMLVM